MNNNLFNNIVNNYKSIMDKDGNNLNMNSIIISDAVGNYFKYLFVKEDLLHPVRSVCKSIVSMCYGKIMYNSDFLYNGEKLTMDTYIWPILKNVCNLTQKNNEEKLEKLTFFHLFTHSIGFDVKLLKSKDIKNIDPKTYIDMVINTPLVYEPGNYFLYSNAAPFLLSVIFQEITGYNLADFANEYIFSKLGITEYKWRNYDKYCAGATGLELKSDDLHKIALLISNDGLWNDEQIVPYEWMKEMKTIKVLTPSKYDVKRVFPKYGYGLLMWICGPEENSNYFIDGSDGQYIIIIPSKKLVISILANQKDMKPITVCLKDLLD